MTGNYEIFVNVFLFVGNSVITENNPDIKTTCDWFAMNIYYVPNHGKNVWYYYKTITQELNDIS